MKFQKLLLFIFFITASLSIAGQNSYPRKITSVEGITEYHLENGLKVLLFPDPSKQTITVNITYLVGSRHEAYGETGMAHLLEHLVFKGTPDHPDIPKELSDHGAFPNGTTWFDRTNYFETFAATEENLRWALDLEADRMINSFIAEKDLDSEMTVVRNEYESGENFPSAVLYKRVLSAAFAWHNYGNSTIGERSDIENVPIERLQAFYRKYYQPDNAVLVVAGKIDEQETLALVEEYFGEIQRPERKLIHTYTEEPVQDGERFVSLRRTGDIQAISCVYHACSAIHPDAAAIQVMMQALTSQPSGRLYKNLIESKIASTISGYMQILSEPGFIYLYSSVPKDKSLEDAQEVLLNTLHDLQDNPLTSEEVERAKAEMLKSIELAQTNTDQIGLTLSEYIAMGDWRMFFINRDRIAAVDEVDVARVSNYYLKPSNRTIGHFIPEEMPDRVHVPGAQPVAEVVDGYVGRGNLDLGEAFDPSPSNIQARTHVGKLESGVLHSFLPKETKGNVVFAHIGFRFGDETSLNGKRTVAAIVPSMLDKGTSSMSRQEIKDQFDKYKAQVNFYGNAGRSFIRIQTIAENFEPALRLAMEILRDPAFPEIEFETLIQQQIAGIEQYKSEPSTKASNAISRHMNPYPPDHISYVETPDETVENLRTLTIDDVRSFYDEYYGLDNTSTITVVGEFEEESVRKIINESLAGWKMGKIYDRPAPNVFEGEPMREEIMTPDKTNAVFFVQQDIPMQDNHPDYPALYVANYLLGGGFLNSRLATRIRQKEGLSYGVGSFFSADGMDQSATFGAQAIYNPENKERVEKAFFEEIQKVIDQGFTQEELDAAKSGIAQSNLVSRAQDGGLLTTINNNMVYGRDMTYYEWFDAKIEGLTLKEVNDSFRKYIRPEKFNVVKAGDFKKGVIKP